MYLRRAQPPCKTQRNWPSTLHLPERPLPAKQGHRDDAYLIGQQRAQSMMQVLTKSRTNTLQKSGHLLLTMRTCQPTKHNCLDSEPFGFVPDQATLDGLLTLLRPRSTRAGFPVAGTPVPRGLAAAVLSDAATRRSHQTMIGPATAMVS